MRAKFSKLHSILGSLPTALALTFLTACTADQPVIIETPEINTKNIYVNYENNTIRLFGRINNSVQVSTIANFSPAPEGFDSVINLNTDPNKQGYEYLAYVTRNQNISRVHLYSYDNFEISSNILLTTLQIPLCGIQAQAKPTGTAFSSGGKSNISEAHQTEIVMALSNSPECDGEIYYEKVSFENLLDSDPLNNFSFSREVMPSEVAEGELIISYSSGARDRFSTADLVGNYGYLGFNRDAMEFSFSYKELNSTNELEDVKWRTFLSSSEPMEIIQASSQNVLIRQGVNIYVLPTTLLFSVDDTSYSSVTPVQAQIDDLLNTPALILNSPNSAKVIVNKKPQSAAFAMLVEDTLYRFSNGSFTTLRTPDSFDPSSTYSFELNGEDEIFVVEDNPIQDDILTFISASNLETTIVSAPDINLSSSASKYYTNTSATDQLSADDKDAHLLEKSNQNYITKTFPDSSILMLKDLRNEADYPVLLSGRPIENINGTRTEAGDYFLYKFDSSTEYGRVQQQSVKYNAAGIGEYKVVDFSFGNFSHFIIDEFIEGTVINDNYALLRLKVRYPDNGIEQSAIAYFTFNPSQDSVDPGLNQQSLKLLELVDVQ